MKKGKGTAKTLLLAAATLLAAACLIYDSRYHLQLTQYDVTFDTLPKEMDGLRIVLISDLHGMVFGRGGEKLAQLVCEQQPDIIAITGDVATDREELGAVELLLQGIYGAAPIYYVRGNHEWYGGIENEAGELMERYGAAVLSNSGLRFERGGSSIVIAGAEDPNGPADMIKPDAYIAQLRRDYQKDFILLLAHRNYWVANYPELPVQLILCGHAHGGIVRLPFIGGLLNTDRSIGATYESGLYRSGGYVMAVSRGLGNSIPVARILNRPELVSLCLHSVQA